MSSRPAEPSLSEAFAHCEALARAHYENFPVGLLVPRAQARYVHVLYAFARTADDFADEPAYAERRLELLDDWRARTEDVYRGRAEGPVFVALRETIERLSIPSSLLLDLLSAFRQDVVKSRYETWAELLDYCRRSADPVGRLVLRVFGVRDPELLPLSDAICTGLQLANHWQDLALDLRERDRLYVPRELLTRFGLDEAGLAAGRLDAPFRALMAELVARSRELFLRGRSLPGRVPARLRLELRLTWLGGMRILDGLEAANYDVFTRRPRHGLFDKAALLWSALVWRAA